MNKRERNRKPLKQYTSADDIPGVRGKLLRAQISQAKMRYDEALQASSAIRHVATENNRLPETPWIASIYYDAPEHDREDHFTATGALIHPQWFVTVAHAFSKDAITPTDLPHDAKSNWRVRIGSSKLRDGKEYEIQDIVRHPKSRYQGFRRKNDIALVKLSEPVNVPVLPWGTEAAEPGDDVIILGWPDGLDGTGVLHEVHVPVIDRRHGKLCLIGPAEFCAANVAPPDHIQHGCSGGPVLRRDGGGVSLVGLVSRGAPFTTDLGGSPEIITDVVAHSDFIGSTLT
jgi:secreted trypsin-like serine protease